MRLHRPFIPLSVRVQVAERQFDKTVAAIGAIDPEKNEHERDMLVFRDFVDREHWRRGTSLDKQLWTLLRFLFGEQRVELHHQPALCNRMRRTKLSGEVAYSPDANDPNHLIYLVKQDHDIETRVRGQHGQHSDLAIARKRKHKERKKTRPKTKWPSRPLRSASRWPKARTFNRKPRKTQP